MSQLSVSKSTTRTELSDLPLEMVEAVLMHTFMSLYIHAIEADDDWHPVKSGKSLSTERRAYTTLASVCWNFSSDTEWLSQSPTSQWVRH